MLVGTKYCSSDGTLQRLRLAEPALHVGAALQLARALHQAVGAQAEQRGSCRCRSLADTAVVASSMPSTPALIVPSARVSFSFVTAARIETSTSGAITICSSRT